MDQEAAEVVAVLTVRSSRLRAVPRTSSAYSSASRAKSFSSYASNVSRSVRTGSTVAITLSTYPPPWGDNLRPEVKVCAIHKLLDPVPIPRLLIGHDLWACSSEGQTQAFRATVGSHDDLDASQRWSEEASAERRPRTEGIRWTRRDSDGLFSFAQR